MNLIKIQLLILFCAKVNPSDGFFTRKFNKVKERAKQYYQKNFGKDRSWHFLDYDPADYPGTNPKYRQENQQKWDLYYSCLREQQRSLGPHAVPVPEAVQGFEGGMVKFECKICLSPNEYEKIDAVEWYFGQLNKPYLEQIFYNDHVMLSPQNKALNIYNLKEEHTGQYACILGDSVTVPYYLTVAKGTNLKEVHAHKARKGQQPQQSEMIKNYNLIIDTEWSEWSPCSTCNNVGKRHKTGYCVVFYNTQDGQQIVQHTPIHPKRHALLKEFKHAMLNDSHKINFKNKLHKNVTAQETDGNVTAMQLDLVKIFVYGIPCRSHILPESIKKLPQVKKRRDEVMVGLCKKPCPKKEVFQVKDKNGKVIETANNSAGIYSMIQGLPPVAPPVERMLQYAELFEKIIIICPGNLNSNMPIHWQIDSKNVVPELIAEESKGRIYISLLDRVHINKAKVSDSKLYSMLIGINAHVVSLCTTQSVMTLEDPAANVICKICWQHDELAGMVRLVVEKKIRLSFNHHIMLLGMLAILGVFVYMFIRAFVGRKHAHMARK